jgi:hypothetical protein
MKCMEERPCSAAMPLKVVFKRHGRDYPNGRPPFKLFARGC